MSDEPLPLSRAIEALGAQLDMEQAALAEQEKRIATLKVVIARLVGLEAGLVMAEKEEEHEPV